MPFNMESTAKTLSVSALLFLFCISNIFAGWAQNFDFFFLVQQWPGSYCDTSNGCCYPSTGKPATDFSIHGLWPNYEDGSYPSNCDSNNPFDPSQISDLRNEMGVKWGSLACPSSNGEQFWKHEWEKHGTCSESILSQHDYFAAALSLKDSVDILGALEKSGIHPDGGRYSLRSIKDALKMGTGYTAGIECNTDESGNKQLYQIYLCVNSSGSNLRDCPALPQDKCSSYNSQVEFPSF